MEDTRNLTDEFKGLPNEEIIEKLAARRSEIEVAIENVEHDFNIGTVVRNANSFNVSKVHIIGKKKYNRRGAMCTDKYLEICHWSTVSEFLADQKERGREVVAIENNTPRALPLGEKEFLDKTTLVFGSEGDGISEELLNGAEDVRYIESFGSTRSVNVGVASGIAMYEWARQRLIRR
ncbi:MAG: TrmH family RNA methyltransferase [Candidatus Saccharibacteria bacterium]|nr:TrmH family RNA methyltransferase [Candidatus Saccharibacteria bacterium]